MDRIEASHLEPLAFESVEPPPPEVIQFCALPRPDDGFNTPLFFNGFGGSVVLAVSLAAVYLLR